MRITRAWTSGIFGEYARDNGGWLIDHFSVPFLLVNPHEGKRQDTSHPEVGTAQLHVLVQHHPIEVAAGGLIVSSLCGGSGPQCPAGVCGATNRQCQGEYWCRLHGSHTEGVP